MGIDKGNQEAESGKVLRRIEDLEVLANMGKFAFEDLRFQVHPDFDWKVPGIVKLDNLTAPRIYGIPIIHDPLMPNNIIAIRNFTRGQITILNLADPDNIWSISLPDLMWKAKDGI